MGYPNPIEIPLKDNATFRGICVYVPDCPEYVRALLGSLAGLSQWVNWERDANKSASKSAELWKLANDLTIASLADACGCDEMNCDDIREVIREELEAMTITITNTNCCGCCGSTNSTNDNYEPLPPGVTYPPMLPVDPDEDTPDPADTIDPDYQQFSCNMAHYMFYLIRQSYLAAHDAHSSSLTFVFQLIETALGFSVKPGGAPKAALNYWSYVALGGRLSDEERIDLIRQLDLNYETLVCALSSTYSATQRREQFVNALSQIAITEHQKRWVLFSMSGIDFGAWFSGTNWETVAGLLPASYQTRTCDCTPTVSNPVWAMYASSGVDGVTTLIRTIDTENAIGGAASVYKSSGYGAYIFQMFLADLEGVANGDITIDFNPGAPNPGWYLQVTNQNDNDTYYLDMPSAGQYTLTTSDRAFPAYDIGKIQLIRKDELYNEQAPRSFTFSFAANWVLL